MREDNANPNDELLLVRLLRLAAPRPLAPPEVESAVRETVRAEWLRATARRRRMPWLAGAAATALAASLVIGFAVLWPAAPLDPVATVERLSGSVRLDVDGDARGWLRIDGNDIAPGSRLVTDGSSRVALRLANGANVRLDYATELAVETSEQLVLERGRIYVDTHAPGIAGGQLLIHTSRGVVSDVGTQFEVAYVDEAVRVRVREGAVTIDRDARQIQGNRGDEVRVGPDGVHRSTIDTFGEHWSWAEEIAPSFDIDGKPLIEFLAWIARETGRELAFASRESEQAARSTVLHGSVQGFSPNEALAAVLATTRLRYSNDRGTLLVDLRTPATTP
ncbi:MAG: FecR domain-containing protein [Gammaproteobacteria bacterium]